LEVIKLDLDEMTLEEMQKIMDSIPEESKKVVASLFGKQMGSEAVGALKKWLLEDFDYNCPVDELLAMTAYQLVFQAGHQIENEMTTAKENGEKYFSSHRATQIVKSVLEKIITSITSIESAEEESVN
jgi:hypothetical protein